MEHPIPSSFEESCFKHGSWKYSFSILTLKPILSLTLTMLIAADKGFATDSSKVLCIPQQ